MQQIVGVVPLKRHSQRGFTLVESLIATLILSIGFLGLAQLLALSVHQTSYARNNSISVGLSQAKLEELRRAYNADLVNGTSHSDLSAGSHGPVTERIVPPSATGQGTLNYLVSWQVLNLSAAQKQVTVTVEPKYKNPLETRAITVTSYFAP